MQRLSSLTAFWAHLLHKLPGLQALKKTSCFFCGLGFVGLMLSLTKTSLFSSTPRNTFFWFRLASPHQPFLPLSVFVSLSFFMLARSWTSSFLFNFFRVGFQKCAATSETHASFWGAGPLSSFVPNPIHALPSSFQADSCFPLSLELVSHRAEWAFDPQKGLSALDPSVLSEFSSKCESSFGSFSSSEPLWGSQFFTPKWPPALWHHSHPPHLCLFLQSHLQLCMYRH